MAQLACASWNARLALDFERRGERTVLAQRHYDGPLAVQKSLYPEGVQTCHSIIVHPPGGTVGGDKLEITARLAPSAHALIMTPGAAKWYRSAALWARQKISFELNSGACLEWFPQETIFFDGAFSDLRTDVQLAADACFIGWEILCFGRTGSGERFSKGQCRAHTVVQREGSPIWLENMQMEGDGTRLDSAAVMAGYPVSGALLAISPRLDAAVVSACRELKPIAGHGAVTMLPALFIGRYLGASTEAAKKYFTELWQVLRPVLVRRAANEPRIWRT